MELILKRKIGFKGYGLCRQNSTPCPEQEAAVRARLTENPYIATMGIEVPELGLGYARFVMPFKPGLANSIGLLQGGMIAALADEAVAYALGPWCPRGN